MSADFDFSALDEAPHPEPKDHGTAVMWPEEMPAYDVLAEHEGISMATATAVILSCIAAGGAAALIFRDAIVALLR